MFIMAATTRYCNGSYVAFPPDHFNHYRDNAGLFHQIKSMLTFGSWSRLPAWTLLADHNMQCLYRVQWSEYIIHRDAPPHYNSPTSPPAAPVEASTQTDDTHQICTCRNKHTAIIGFLLCVLPPESFPTGMHVHITTNQKGSAADAETAVCCHCIAAKTCKYKYRWGYKLGNKVSLEFI